MSDDLQDRALIAAPLPAQESDEDYCGVCDRLRHDLDRHGVCRACIEAIERAAEVANDY